MIKRTVEISQQPVHLSVLDGQLILAPKTPSPPPETAADANACDTNAASTVTPAPRRGVRARMHANDTGRVTIPCEDVGLLLVEEQSTTYTHAALVTLLRHDAAVVLCGRDHLPAGLLLPMTEHSQVVWRLQAQITVKRPLQKQLWRQIVQAKIRAQAANLAHATDTRSKLLALARNVRSGDPENVEAQAARAYWSAWLLHVTAAPFRRDPDGPAPNNLLNYGYAVMRAAVARAIVAAGLLPVLGLKHSNRSNAFCLADDLVEPLRPLVDRAVQELVRQDQTEVTPDTKRVLLGLLADDVRYADQTGPLMVALHRYAASLAKCYAGEADALEIPTACT